MKKHSNDAISKFSIFRFQLFILGIILIIRESGKKDEILLSTPTGPSVVFPFEIFNFKRENYALLN